MPKSRVDDNLVLEPAESKEDRFAEVDAYAFKLLDDLSHLRKVAWFGIFGFAVLFFITWEHQTWLALLSLIVWITIAGSYVIPQAKKEANRSMNTLIAKASFLNEQEGLEYLESEPRQAIGSKLEHASGFDLLSRYLKR